MIVLLWNKLLKKMRGSAVRKSVIDKTASIGSGSQITNTTINKNSYCGYDCKLLNCDIGSYCSIADGVIIGGARHPIEWASTSPVFFCDKSNVKKKFSHHKRPDDARTIVGNDVWIGERVLIKAGVQVSDGAVIGMGSVVTKDIGPYEIWAGNPARFIRKRFSKEIIDRMIMAKWWELDDTKLTELALMVKEPEDFLNNI